MLTRRVALTSLAAAAIASSQAKKMKATGTFVVKMGPLKHEADDVSMGRMSIDKQFHGDLEASSVGQMLTGGDFRTGSAGYVAIEKVTGTLQGRRGSFLLQHTGTMNKGAAQLTVTVIPDSGTGELKGIAGTLTIIIEGSKHSYELEYTLEV